MFHVYFRSVATTWLVGGHGDRSGLSAEHLRSPHARQRGAVSPRQSSAGTDQLIAGGSEQAAARTWAATMPIASRKATPSRGCTRALRLSGVSKGSTGQRF